VKRNLLSELDSGGDAVRVLPLAAADADLLCAAAGERGYSCAQADLAGCADKETFLSRIADALEFPDWFGRNWDAFFDCLTDLSWLPARGHVLVLLNTAEMRRDAPEAFDTALSIMQEAAQACQKREGSLWVVMDAPPLTRASPAPRRARRKRRKT
jgi:RNAse (barnase) inhibitor barstar